MNELLGKFELDHVGVVAAEGRHPFFEALALATDERKSMPSGVCVSKTGPNQSLELVWPEKEGSPVDRFLERSGPGLHHIALRVYESLEIVGERLKAAGVETAGGIEPSADGRPSLFLHPRSMGGVLVELVEGDPR